MLLARCYWAVLGNWINCPWSWMRSAEMNTVEEPWAHGPAPASHTEANINCCQAPCRSSIFMAKKYQSSEHFMLYNLKINLLCKVVESPYPLGFLAAVDFTAFVPWIQNPDFKHRVVERESLKFQPTAPLSSTAGAWQAYSKTPLCTTPCPSGAPFLGKPGCFSRTDWGLQLPCNADEGHPASGSGCLLQNKFLYKILLFFTSDLQEYPDFSLCYFCLVVVVLLPSPSPLFFSPFLPSSCFW